MNMEVTSFCIIITFIFFISSYHSIKLFFTQSCCEIDKPLNYQKYTYANLINICMICLSAYCIFWNEQQLQNRINENNNILLSNSTCCITFYDYTVNVYNEKMFVRIFYRLGTNFGGGKYYNDSIFIQEYNNYDETFFPKIGTIFQCWFYNNMLFYTKPEYIYTNIRKFTYYYMCTFFVYIIIQCMLFCCWCIADWPCKQNVEENITENNFNNENINIILNNIENSKNDKLLCKICYDNVIDILITPCNHLILCSECYDKIDKCPICNKENINFLKIYM